MPRPRHPLEEVTYTLIEENPKAGPETLRKELEKQALQALAKLGVTDEKQIEGALGRLPPPSTIGRIKSRYYKEKSEAERSEYRYVRWPETFEAGALPWEAARVVLDLLRMWAVANTRPTVRLARWAWRLYLAAPDVPQHTRWEAALDLATSEVLGLARRDIEWWLAFAPWSGDEQRAEYGRFVEGAFPFDSHGGQGPIRAYEHGRRVVPRELTYEEALAAMLATGLLDHEEAEGAARNMLSLWEEAIALQQDTGEERGTQR